MRVLPLLAHSPNLNSIEHVWDIIGPRFQYYAVLSTNVEVLRALEFIALCAHIFVIQYVCVNHVQQIIF